MASKPSKPTPTIELLQLLTVLGVNIDNDDSLPRVSPAFLEARLQTYLGFTQPDILAAGAGKAKGGKIEIGKTEDVGTVDLKAYETAEIHGGAGAGHGHGHSHGGGGDDHGHSHGGGGDHGHSHGGAPCTGHGEPEDVEEEEDEDEEEDTANAHGHTHGGAPCTGHGEEDEEDDEEEEEDDHDTANAHGHTHGGAPCTGHDNDDEDESSGPQTNQVLRALRHYISILTQGIQQAWTKPPLFPGAPRRNIWVLREPTRDGKPAPSNQGHDLVLTIAGAATLPVPPTPPTSDASTTPPATTTPTTTPVILLYFAPDTPTSRKGLWGDTMQLTLPREILHLLTHLLTANSALTPPFRAFDAAQVGTAAAGFKPSFLVPVAETSPPEAQVGRLDLGREALGKLVGCDVCGGLGPDLKCARCKGRTYCSAGCQRSDWKGHKGVCGN